MNLTFLSRSLGRNLDLDDVSALDQSSLRKLHAELVIAISAMDEHISEPTWPNKEAYAEWLQRAKRKRRICVAFETQVKYLLDTVHNATTLLEQAYQRHLERLVQDELGSTVFADIRAEAQALARKDFQETTVHQLRS
jgi:hypothetical protein